METVFLSLSKNEFQDLIAETVCACLERNRFPLDSSSLNNSSKPKEQPNNSIQQKKKSSR